MTRGACALQRVPANAAARVGCLAALSSLWLGVSCDGPNISLGAVPAGGRDGNWGSSISTAPQGGGASALSGGAAALGGTASSTELFGVAGVDTLPRCGDGSCATTEALTCPEDCGYCGDNYCADSEPGFCTQDCGGTVIGCPGAPTTVPDPSGPDAPCASLEVGTNLPCEIEVPITSNYAIAPSRITLYYQPSVGGTEELPRLASASDCTTSANGGWYVDLIAPSNKITFCPCTCDHVGTGTTTMLISCESAAVD